MFHTTSYFKCLTQYEVTELTHKKKNGLIHCTEN